MKIFLSIISLVFIISCSAKVQEPANTLTEKEKEKINKQKGFAQQLFIDASLLDLEGKYAEAILDYQEALKLDPNAGIYYALGKDYFKLNKLLPALDNTKKAVELEEDNIEYLTLLGTIYSVSRNVDSAEVVFNKIISVDSTDINAHYNLAQLYEANQPLRALDSYNRILDITGPPPIMIWTMIK